MAVKWKALHMKKLLEIDSCTGCIYKRISRTDDGILTSFWCANSNLTDGRGRIIPEDNFRLAIPWWCPLPSLPLLNEQNKIESPTYED